MAKKPKPTARQNVRKAKANRKNKNKNEDLLPNSSSGKKVATSDKTPSPRTRELQPRTVSVFRNTSVLPETDGSQGDHPDDYFLPNDTLPTSSPLSSKPFFIWATLGVFIAAILVIFWTSFAGSLMDKPDSTLRESLLTFLNANSRSLGMLLASVITLCAIAIPLTANNYTSKLIELFTNSKVNRSMLGLLVVSNCLNLLALLLFDLPGNWPIIEVIIAASASTLCFVLVIPYAFYVFHFLQPDEITRHIEKEVMTTLLEIKKNGNHPELEENRKKVIQNIKNLSNIALRSVERHDRDTTMLSLEALRHVVHYYFSFKDQMPSQWFHASRMYFLSFSGEMRRRVEHEKTFLEAEIMEEFSLILSVTFGRLRDAVKMISLTLRHIGVEANEKGLYSVLELTSIYFNTFIRAAISRKEPEAVYIIIYHYRRMAEEMFMSNEHRPTRVAYYLSYYGNQAIHYQMAYVTNLISYDLANMTALAYEKDAPSKRKIFDIFMDFDRRSEICDQPDGLKGRIKLAVILHHLGYQEEQEELCDSMKNQNTSLLQNRLQALSEVTHPMFWEVSDRHRHNDYIAPELNRSFMVVKQRLLG